MFVQCHNMNNGWCVQHASHFNVCFFVIHDGKKPRIRSRSRSLWAAAIKHIWKLNEWDGWWKGRKKCNLKCIRARTHTHEHSCGICVTVVDGEVIVHLSRWCDHLSVWRTHFAFVLSVAPPLDHWAVFFSFALSLCLFHRYCHWLCWFIHLMFRFVCLSTFSIVWVCAFTYLLFYSLSFPLSLGGKKDPLGFSHLKFTYQSRLWHRWCYGSGGGSGWCAQRSIHIPAFLILIYDYC